MNKTKIFNTKIITPNRVIENGCVLIMDGKIEMIKAGNVDTEEYECIDAKCNILSPGFIDIHVHGGGGYDFMDGDVESLLGAAKMHAKHGTTSLSPTTLASKLDEVKKFFDVYRSAIKRNIDGAGFIGIHLEGPYFSLKQAGAQDPRYIKNPDKEEYLKILSWSDDIIRWSAAPELDGALEFGRDLKSRGILASIAHTDAIYEQVLEAYENGFTHSTHLYSAMSGVKRIDSYRFAGAIEAAFLIDDMTVEIIADGCHLPSSLLKLIYKIKGPEKIALITDSMRAAGMPDGESIVGSLKEGQKVIIEDGVAKMPNRKSFAGSVATTDKLVRTMIGMAEVPLMEAVKMMTITPAKVIGIDHTKGSIAIGKDADLVIFDNKINILMTMISGKKVYGNL